MNYIIVMRAIKLVADAYRTDQEWSLLHEVEVHVPTDLADLLGPLEFGYLLQIHNIHVVRWYE